MNKKNACGRAHKWKGRPQAAFPETETPVSVG
jgi:hypothetical protein